MSNLQKSKETSTAGIFIIIGLVWTIVIAGFFIREIREARNQTRNLALYQGRSFFQEITTSRSWNALHAGVYVPVSESVQPNPYMDVPDRDILTVDGRKLTKINPAFMTRQIGALAAKKNLVWFHLTSEKPIRPGNEPDAWERKALQRFEAGEPEYFDLVDLKIGAPNFRYMAPLRVNPECLQCHAKQGYKEGDIRGGISVTVNAGPLIQIQDRHFQVEAQTSLIIWILGLFGIMAAAFRTEKAAQERKKTIDELQHALSEVKQLSGLLPICASCKKIRDDKGYWNQIELYIHNHSEAEFSHGLPGLHCQAVSGLFEAGRRITALIIASATQSRDCQGAVPVAYACGSEWNFSRNDDQGVRQAKPGVSCRVRVPVG